MTRAADVLRSPNHLARLAEQIGGKLGSIGDKLRCYSAKGWPAFIRHHFDLFEAIEIETLTACNRRCTYCPNFRFERGLVKNKKYMEESLFKKIIDELSDIGFRGRVSPHFYGEPLMDERLCDLLAYVHDKIPAAEIAIFTNGDFLTPEYYKRLVDAGVRCFVITEHGEQMPRAVRATFAYRKEHGGQGVEFTYRKYTADTPLDNRGGLVEHDLYIRRDSCYNPSREVIVDHAGNVVLCCNDYFSSVSFGNLRNQRLLDVWFSEDMKRIRQETKEGVFNLDICKTCVNNG